MGLRSYLLKRTVNTAILIVFVILLNFIILAVMPGSAGSIDLIASNPRLTQEQKAAAILREGFRYGIYCAVDKDGNGVPCPIWTKFERYFVQMITFQFGNSYTTGNSVIHDAVSSGKLVNTLLLLGTSSIIAIVIGVFLGVIAARKRGSVFDSSMVTGALQPIPCQPFGWG